MIFDLGEAMSDGFFSLFLELGIDGGFDDEATLFDVLFFEDAFEVELEGLEGEALVGFSVCGFSDVEGFVFGVVSEGLGDGVGFDHLFENPVALGGGFFHTTEGGERVRGADDADEHGGLGEGEFFGWDVEVVLGGGFNAVDIAAPEDAVHVVFEDFIFFVVCFDTDCDEDFEELSVESADDSLAIFFELKGIAGELHGDGTTPFYFSSSDRA